MKSDNKEPIITIRDISKGELRHMLQKEDDVFIVEDQEDLDDLEEYLDKKLEQFENE